MKVLSILIIACLAVAVISQETATSVVSETPIVEETPLESTSVETTVSKPEITL